MKVLRPPSPSMTRSRATHRRLVVLLSILSVVALVSAVAGFLTSKSHEEESVSSGLPQFRSEPKLENDPPVVAPYVPLRDEVTPNGKALAARVAQEALTYSRGERPKAIVNRLRKFGAPVTPGVVIPGYDRESRSWARTIYPQMSGLTSDSMGAMVLTRQTLEDADGELTSVTRVVDVRLKLVNGAWRLDELASVGGRPPREKVALSGAAQRVLANERIDLPDSSRWDICRGEVSESVLEALERAAAIAPLRVAVLKTGHPPNVWATDNPSAHSEGLAADVWAVRGTPVLEQREVGSPAYAMAETFFSNGAVQVGSPWTFTTDGFQTFTDEVHQDHLHVQD